MWKKIITLFWKTKSALLKSPKGFIWCSEASGGCTWLPHASEHSPEVIWSQLWRIPVKPILWVWIVKFELFTTDSKIRESQICRYSGLTCTVFIPVRPMVMSYLALWTDNESLWLTFLAIQPFYFFNWLPLIGKGRRCLILLQERRNQHILNKFLWQVYSCLQSKKDSIPHVGS